MKRTLAVVLSLAMPGSGHFLLGAFGRGAVWAIALPLLGLLLFSTMSLLGVLAVTVVALVGRIAPALDAALVASPEPSWKKVTAMWAALLLGNLVLAAPLAAYIRTNYVQGYNVPSEGMEPTLLIGDRLLVDKSVYRERAPERGDIVTFSAPLDAEPRTYVKRTLGLPGDTIQVRNKALYVNGNAVDESYAQFLFPPPGTNPDADGDPRVHYGPVTVPPDSYFVLGDNRDNSEDSRYFGFVARQTIEGRAVGIYWSWDAERWWPRLDRIGRAP